jgi:hypothetical protein
MKSGYFFLSFPVIDLETRSRDLERWIDRYRECVAKDRKWKLKREMDDQVGKIHQATKNVFNIRISTNLFFYECFSKHL